MYLKNSLKVVLILILSVKFMKQSKASLNILIFSIYNPTIKYIAYIQINYII